MSQPLNVIFGAGPVGRSIARQLLAAGQKVRIVSRTGTAPGLDGAEAFRADAMQPDAAIAAAQGASTVYHCAAPGYTEWVTKFPPLQDNIVAAAAKAGAVLVVLENLYGYGVAGTLTENMPLLGNTRKGRARADMSTRLFAEHRAGTVRVVSGRSSDFFGPEVEVTTLGDRVFPQLLAGKTISWVGNPDALHSFTYVPDFAAALIRLASAPDAWGRAWHVASPPVQSPRAVMTQAAALAGLRPPKISRVPKVVVSAMGLFIPLLREVAEMTYSFEQPFVMSHADWDATFGTTATGWDPALRATLDWWKSRPR